MNKEQIIKEWDKLFELQEDDREYFKVVEDYNGDDWLIAFGRDAETNKEYSITTNRVHASELADMCGGSKEDAEFFVNVMNLKHNGKFKRMEEFIKANLLK